MKLLYITLFTIMFSTMNCQILASVDKKKQKIDCEIKNIVSNIFENDIRIERMLFVFKIDSIGEIHSSHIVSNGFDATKNYKINSMIEEKINVYYLISDNIKKEFKNRKYVSINYPWTGCEVEP